MRRLGFALALLLLAGTDDFAVSAGVYNWDSVEIRLERGICFGTCPAYMVTIHGDGRVVFIGGSFIAKPGRHESRIDPNEVRVLYAKFMAARFFTLRDEYRGEITDLPTYIVTLVADGQEKTVTDYAGGLAGMPAAVTELEAAIDAAANTAQWVQN